MKIGIDIFKDETDAILKNRNFALITGSSNIDGSGTPVYQAVKKSTGNRLKAIWALQHGFFIDKQDNMILSDSFYWKAMDLEIKSLYGEKLLPEPSWLENIDALVIDVLDVGTRVYTFVNHVIMILKALSGQKIDIIVLDRPNPLAGMEVEGNVLEPNYFSIVGQLPVPMRHALTAGEYLSYGLSYYGIDLQLEVVTVPDWDRETPFSGTWTYPSPNMPTFQTAVVYPGAVMLEGTNLSEGRGTTRPFEFVGAPFIDNFKLVAELENSFSDGSGLADVIPVYFKPEFSKFSGDVCKGVLVNPTDFQGFRSFPFYYELIRLVKHLYPEDFKWKEPPYEFEYKRPPIDMICGSPLIREAIEKNQPYRELESQIDKQLDAYKERIADHLLY